MGQELKNNFETLDKLTNSILTVYVEFGNPMQDSKFHTNIQIKLKSTLIYVSLTLPVSTFFLSK